MRKGHDKTMSWNECIMLQCIVHEQKKRKVRNDWFRSRF